eukprot:scaffold70542_cov33-Tisochrysis_lutea.AAC.2
MSQRKTPILRSTAHRARPRMKRSALVAVGGAAPTIGAAAPPPPTTASSTRPHPIRQQWAVAAADSPHPQAPARRTHAAPGLATQPRRPSPA